VKDVEIFQELFEIEM